MTATAAELVQVDRAVSEVRRQHRAATLKVAALKAAEGGAVGTLLGPVGQLVGAVVGYFQDPSAAELALKKLEPEVERWAAVQRGWVVRGRRDDGMAYSARDFLAYGRDTLAAAIRQHSEEAFDASLFAVPARTVETVVQATREVARAVEVATRPSEWPLWVKLTIAATAVTAVGVAGVVVMGVVGPYVRRLPGGAS